MFLKNNFAGNARGNLLLALKVDIARTKFIEQSMTQIKHLTLDISDKRSPGGDIYQRGIERIALLTTLHLMHFTETG